LGIGTTPVDKRRRDKQQQRLTKAKANANATNHGSRNQPQHLLCIHNSTTDHGFGNSKRARLALDQIPTATAAVIDVVVVIVVVILAFNSFQNIAFFYPSLYMDNVNHTLLHKQGKTYRLFTFYLQCWIVVRQQAFTEK